MVGTSKKGVLKDALEMSMMGSEATEGFTTVIRPLGTFLLPDRYSHSAAL